MSHPGMPRDISYCPASSIHYRRLPYSPEGLPHSPRGALCPRRTALQSPSIPNLQEGANPWIQGVGPRGHTGNLLQEGFSQPAKEKISKSTNE